MVVCSLGGFWACGPRSPPEGPKQRRRERERKATGTPEAADSQRAREPESQKQQSQRAREEAQGSATDGFFLYIGASFPARGARREAEIGAGGLVVCSLGCFWARGPRSPPEGPKQRRRRRRERERKATGTPEAAEAESQRGSPRECNRRALPIYRGPVPGKGRPEKQRLEPEGWLSVVWVAFGLAGPGPRQRAPSREGERGKGRQRGRRKQQTARELESQKQQSQRAREEAQGSATDGFFLYIGASFPARGAGREAEIGAGGLVVCSLGCFWARGPRSPPEGPKQRRRRRRERERKATGTPEAGLRAPVPAKGPKQRRRRRRERQRGRQKQQRQRAREEAQGSATDGLCLYIGAPFPARGARRSRDWSRRVGCLYFGWLLGLRVPVPARGPQAGKEREGKEGNGDAGSSREPESQKQQSQRAREEAQGSATDGLFLYIEAPFPARGARREAEIGAGGLAVSSLDGFWACGPRSPPEGPKQRRRRRRERERKATGTPEGAEAESQRGSPRECNRRALPIYRGPVPGKGRRREAEIGAGGLVVSTLGGFWACGPRSPPEEKERERGNGDARSSRGREPERKPKGVQQTGFAYI